MLTTPTEELIADIRAGKMIVLIDDEQEESEGHVVVAAEHICPAVIRFMATQARGLICLNITTERNQQLQLQQSRKSKQSSLHISCSIEAATGISTGISAADRALTIKTAIAQDARPSDLVQPGHIYPMIAHEGGVLSCAAYAEASTDFAALAGLNPTAVSAKILQLDGSAATRAQVLAFAQEHSLNVGTIADLITYRLTQTPIITRTAHCELPTPFGTFQLNTYRHLHHPTQLHFALSHGKIHEHTPTFVRVHVQNALSDLFNASENSYSLQDALKRLACEESGVVVVLDSSESYQTVEERIHALQNPEQNYANVPQSALRAYGVGAQILVAEGVRQMRLLSSPRRFASLSGYGLHVHEYLSR